jgi:hypothetical protein
MSLQEEYSLPQSSVLGEAANRVSIFHLVMAVGVQLSTVYSIEKDIKTISIDLNRKHTCLLSKEYQPEAARVENLVLVLSCPPFCHSSPLVHLVLKHEG